MCTGGYPYDSLTAPQEDGEWTRPSNKWPGVLPAVDSQASGGLQTDSNTRAGVFKPLAPARVGGFGRWVNPTPLINSGKRGG